MKLVELTLLLKNCAQSINRPILLETVLSQLAFLKIGLGLVFWKNVLEFLARKTRVVTNEFFGKRRTVC